MQVEKFSNISAYALFVYGFIIISPVFAAIFSGSSFLLSIVVLAIVIFMAFKSNLEYSTYFLISLFSILITLLVLSLITEDVSYILDMRYFIFSLILVYSVTLSTLYRVTEIASFFIMALLIGGLISLILSMLGIGAIGSFPNPDGRLNNIYFFTFSNVGWVSLLRPAGIYDEPGAFSFFICGLAATRHLFKMDNKKTWIILLMGLQTLSVAHVLYIIFHAIASQNIQFKFIFRVLTVFIIINFIAFIDTSNNITNQFIGRFNITTFGEGRLVGIFKIIDYLKENSDNFLIGARALYDSGGGYEDYWESMDILYGGSMGGNILFPVAANGLIISMPFLFIFLSLTCAPLFRGRYYIVALGIAALLYNREYIYVLSYSMVIIMVFRIAYSRYEPFK
ncbi:hypothetical protein N9797_01760 [Gammaproteobacteria bacterium]|nr:hypothetical protein [Gammaproteobacteria bacterium]